MSCCSKDCGGDRGVNDSVSSASASPIPAFATSITASATVSTAPAPPASASASAAANNTAPCPPVFRRLPPFPDSASAMPPQLDTVLRLAQQVLPDAATPYDAKLALLTTLELWSRRIILEIASKVEIQASPPLGHNPLSAQPVYQKRDGVCMLSTSSNSEDIIDVFDNVMEDNGEYPESSRMKPFTVQNRLASTCSLAVFFRLFAPANTEINCIYTPKRHNQRAQNLAQTVHSIFTAIPREGTLDEAKLRSLYTTALEGYLFAGCMAFALRQYARSAFLNATILLFSPTYVEALYNQATTMVTSGHKEEAVFWWEMTLRQKPAYWAAAEQLALLHMQNSDDKRAISAIARCINYSIDHDIVPNNLQAWTKLTSLYHSIGNIYYSQKLIFRAASIFSKCVILCCDENHLKGGFSWQKIDKQQFRIKDQTSQSDLSDLPPQVTPGSTGQVLPAEVKNLSVAISNSLLAWFMEDRTHVANLGPLLASQALLVTPRKAMQVRFRLYGALGLPPLLLRMTLLQSPDLGRLTETGYELKDPEHAASRITVPSSALPMFQTITITLANALLNLAKILQDGINSGQPNRVVMFRSSAPTFYDILALYLLSLSLNPSASTSNNIGILLNSISADKNSVKTLALAYYRYGLSLDPNHPHLYTNLGSLYKEQGKLQESINMYLSAVRCDPRFDTALGNLAAAYQDSGQTPQAIFYYQKAVEVNPSFPEAISGLANCMASVCDWKGRGGHDGEEHAVNHDGDLCPGPENGWMTHLINVLDTQLRAGDDWGLGVVHDSPTLIEQLKQASGARSEFILNKLSAASNHPGEGKAIVWAVETATRLAQLRWYHDRNSDASNFPRPRIPPLLHVPAASTVIPFHTFTLPVTKEQVRGISELAALKVSVSTLLQPWLPSHVYPPPQSPEKCGGRLTVGYVSSDFQDHPLAHLMQSVFGLHDTRRVRPICYATTPSDNSSFRSRIERDAEVKDVSQMTTQQIVDLIVSDGVHVLVNLNGYTKGARNEVFAARPVPVQVSLMGYAGTMGAGWIDYLFADSVAVGDTSESERVFSERLILAPPSFFCCDHRQTAPDSYNQRKRRQSDMKGSGEIAVRDETTGTASEVSGIKREPPQAVPGAKRSKTAAEADTIMANEGEQTPLEYALAQLASNPTFDGYNSDEPLYEKRRGNSDASYDFDNEDPFEDSVLENSLDKRDSDLSVSDEEVPVLPPFSEEQKLRLNLRKQLFPDIDESAVILGNFNQLYKITPATLRMWLEILKHAPKSYLWLLQFPLAGEGNLREMATKWYSGSDDPNKRILFTPVSPKDTHITRSRVCDLFLDTPECNAHTTAADVIWNGTPIITYPRHPHKMCSRVAASIVSASVPHTAEGREIADTLVVHSDKQYVSTAVQLCGDRAKLTQFREVLYSQRESGDFFDTEKWVRKLEKGLWRAWTDWTRGKHEDVSTEVEG